MSVENNHKAVDKATKGMEVCIKIDPIPGDAPKMFGRHFDETDLLYSKVRKNHQISTTFIKRILYTRSKVRRGIRYPQHVYSESYIHVLVER